MRHKLFARIAISFALPTLLLFVGCTKEESQSPEATRQSSTDIVAASPSADADSASVISGKIILKGTPPQEREMTMDASCGKLHSTPPKTRIYVVGEAGELADVFVYIKEGLSGKTFVPSEKPVLLDQIGCEYTPYVLGLQTGQKLLVRNSDPMMHNVHTMPKVAGNKPSNKAQMPKSKDFEYTFENPESFLTFKCDVHPWMYAYVNVVNHPFFSISANDGTFHLKNVPDGKYQLEAYHRRAGKQTKEVIVADGKADPIHFTFELP